MKSLSHIAIVPKDAPFIPIDSGLIGLLALENGSDLYSILLQHLTARTGQVPDNLRATLIASPLHTNAWGRLIRASFTLSPEAGKLHQLQEIVDQARLYERFLDCNEALDLGGANLIKHSGITPRVTNLREGSIQPTVTMVFEVPLKERHADWERELEDQPDLAKQLLELHGAIHKLLDPPQNSPEDEHKAAGVVSDLLKRFVHERAGNSIRVDWVSPLRTLNILAHSSNLAGAPASQSAINSAKRSLPIVHGTHGWRLDLGKWQADLRAEKRTVLPRHESHTGNRFRDADLAAIYSADSDEMTLTLRFVDLARRVVASFVVEVPSRGIEHRWKRWISDVIRSREGNVLSLHGSARFGDGRWARVHVIASFALCQPGSRTPSVDNVSTVLDCFRALRRPPDSLYGEWFDTSLRMIRDVSPGSDYRRRVAYDCLGASAGEEVISERNPPSMDMDLHSLSMWYRWEEHPARDYRDRFKPNPFDFTRPLDLETHERLYPPQGSTRREASRLRLVDRIVERVTGERSENIIVIGAHRSGKSSILSMVCDTIKKAPSANAEIVSVPLRINSATTPPHLAFFEILRQLVTFSRQPVGADRESAEMERRSATLIGRLLEKMGFKSPADPVTKSVGPAASASLGLMLGGDWGASFMGSYIVDALMRLFAQESGEGGQATVNGDRPTPSPQEWNALLASTQNPDLIAERRASFLQESLNLLAKSLNELNSRATGHLERGREQRLRIVLAIDELSESARWGSNWSFPAWRHVLEDSKFRDIAWIFASSRAVDIATDYSSLGNVLREYNLTPLTDSEVREFLDNFERESSRPRNAEDGPELTPVITSDCRSFLTWITGGYPYLLQVCSTHIYEQAVFYHVPVIGSKLARHVTRKRIMGELADFFLAAWKDFGVEERTAVLDRVAPGVNVFKTWSPRKTESSFPPALSKALERAGLLSSTGSGGIVPLFAQWIADTHAVRSHPGGS